MKCAFTRRDICFMSSCRPRHHVGPDANGGEHRLDAVRRRSIASGDVKLHRKPFRISRFGKQRLGAGLVGRNRRCQTFGPTADKRRDEKSRGLGLPAVDK